MVRIHLQAWERVGGKTLKLFVYQRFTTDLPIAFNKFNILVSCRKMTGKPGQTQLLAKEKEKKENVRRRKLFGHWAVLVVT